ncbi:DUF3068 domain-containing protein [Virgisporangium aurantiacum]|uniref:DUF3068 domain-containing protein n=1 Tax=Virgisporangium aurantiacum TaxID=175570 RepID=A0A8J3ZAU4_9ACTN|nr:DUF3068 domain-containing protein [Virgisporangium aurantiacum]GIJ58380.1 hypothetical protein Vau01_058960 [Virgisporangium aurantiacum]
MRRVAGILLVTLGAFGITLGLLMPTVIYDRLAVAPLDPDSETVAQGTNMTVFYPGELAKGGNPIRTDATVTARRIVSGQYDAPEVKLNGDVALWRVGLVVEDERGTLINAIEQWVCVDRRTAEGLQDCEKEKIDDGTETTDVDQRGLQYKFPFDTQKKDYTFFDISLRRALPIAYDGEESVNGLATYRFVQRIEPTKVKTQQVPGSLFGSTEGTLSSDQMYENVRKIWVEPHTGQIVKGEEQQRQFLQGPGNKQFVVLAGTLAWTPQTVQQQVDKASEAADRLVLLTRTGPIVMWTVGGLMVIGGVLLLVSGRGTPRSRHRGRPKAVEPEPVPTG